jgi:flagellar basal-body rod protein FlgF
VAQGVLGIETMNVSLFQAAASLNANSRWQEVIADNLASGSVPGFRKQQLCVAAVQAGLMPASGVGGSGGVPVFTVPKVSTVTSFEPGELKYTGSNNDVAIDGKAFFEIQLPSGQSAFTRDGEFQISAKGQLVTKQGYAVLSNTGPVQLDPSNGAPMLISADGTISQGGDVKGQLKLTEFTDPQLLTQITGGYFLANDPKLQPQPSTSSVRQGYLEGSNVSMLGEMAGMMTAMRGFEAGQHLVQIQDDRMGKAISELGSPT